MEIQNFKNMEDIENSLNQLFTSLKTEKIDFYISIKSKELIQTIRLLKNRFKRFHLSTIIVLDHERNYRLLYPFLIKLKEESLKRLILAVDIEKQYPFTESIVHEIPGAIFYEREVFDMMGIKFINHPNLQRMFTPELLSSNIFPLRKNITFQELREELVESRKIEAIEEKSPKYEGNGSKGYISEKSDYSISVGPQHPSLEEPIRFIFHVEGETVKNVNLKFGFNHRGIEKAFESRTWSQNLYLAERICGICSNAHQLCYVQAVEDCAKISDMIPERVKYIRVIMAELERVHSHLLWYGILAHNVGFDSLFHYTWRDREIIMDILEEISGNRVNYAMHRIGGVRRDISPDQVLRIIPKLSLLKEKILNHQQMMMREKSLISRLKDIAVLSKKDAKRLCTVGPNARASGVNQDFRKDIPYAAYNQFSFDIPTTTEGDILSGLVVRLEESIIAIDLTIEALNTLPQGNLAIKAPRRIPEGEGISSVEAPRGENLHFVYSNGSIKPERHKVRAPTLANMPSLLYRLIGVQVADIPPVIRVIDPCIGCMDRVTFVNLKNQKKIDISRAQLISRANRAYRLGTNILEF